MNNLTTIISHSKHKYQLWFRFPYQTNFEFTYGTDDKERMDERIKQNCSVYGNAEYILMENKVGGYDD